MAGGRRAAKSSGLLVETGDFAGHLPIVSIVVPFWGYLIGS